MDNRKFDLIEHVLKLKTIQPDTFKKVDKSYESKMNFQEVTSKKIFATKQKSQKLFFHLRVENESTVILMGITNNLYIFDFPADFFIPTDTQTIETCEDLHQNIINGEVEGIEEYAEVFYKKYILENNQPKFIPIQTIARAKLGDSQKFKNYFYEKERNKYSIVITGDEPTPVGPGKTQLDILDNNKSDGSDICLIIRDMFSLHPIMKIETIKKLYNELGDNIKSKYNFYRIKYFLPVIAYVYNSTPWYKTWILYGLDPKRDIEMFKYQAMFSKNLKNEYQVFDIKNILELINGNRENFLTEKFSRKTGFITPCGHYEILKLLNISKEVSSEEEAFEIYD